MPTLQLNNPTGGRPLQEFKVDVEDGLWIYRLGYVECEDCKQINSISVNLQVMAMLTEMAQKSTDREVSFNVKEIIAKVREKLYKRVKTA